MAVKASQETVEESMDSTVTPTPPKFPQDFTVAHFLDRIGRSPTEVDGDDAKVGGLLRKAAHQPDVAALQPDLARPGLDPMDSSVGAMGPSLGGRASRGLARFLIIFSIGIGATLAWQSYGDAARAMLANSSPQLGWLAPQTAPLAQTTPSMVTPPAADTASSDLQQLTAAVASMRQSVDQLAAQLAAGQQQVADNIAKLHADEQKILQKLSATPQKLSGTPPGATAAPARKPTPATAPPSPSASPSASAQPR
jgi:outer membrane murein-binding lipoprotein Lpp